MKDTNTLPEVILDLTDESKTLDEAIAECEARRQYLLKPWYKKIMTKKPKALKAVA